MKMFYTPSSFCLFLLSYKWFGYGFHNKKTAKVEDFHKSITKHFVKYKKYNGNGNAMPPEFGRKWGTECLNTGFPLPTLQCAAYSVKLIYFVYLKNTKKLNEKDLKWTIHIRITKVMQLPYCNETKNLDRTNLLTKFIKCL